jgi:hypothetical protein
LFDINHSGMVDPLDVLLVSVSGDSDADTDVDLADFASAQACVRGSGSPFDPWGCGLTDLDLDGDVDAEDLYRLVCAWTGPLEHAVGE